jgi:hypothetical protein
VGFCTLFVMSGYESHSLKEAGRKVGLRQVSCTSNLGLPASQGHKDSHPLLYIRANARVR